MKGTRNFFIGLVIIIVVIVGFVKVSDYYEAEQDAAHIADTELKIEMRRLQDKWEKHQLENPDYNPGL